MTDANELRDVLESIADDHGEIDGGPTLTVTYETRQGNERTRSGEAWYVSDGTTFDDAVIRFSENAGDANEDPYYIRVRGDDMTLVSISDQGLETDLGGVVSVDVDGVVDERRAVADGGRDYDRHDIRLRDVVQHGEPKCPDDMGAALVASYSATYRPNSTFTEVRDVSVRLPFECIVLFDDGVIEIDELSATERAWLRAESDGKIDFEGTECGPDEVAA